MYKCNKCGLEYDDIDKHNIDCESGFIAEEYENLIPCEICNTLVNFEDYNEHITNCNNPFNSLFQNIQLTPENNSFINTLINTNNPNVIFVPFNNQIPNPNNEQHLEDDTEDEHEDEDVDESEQIEININNLQENEENNLQENEENNLQENEEIIENNQGNPHIFSPFNDEFNINMNNILSNLVQNILTNQDLNINIPPNENSYEELTNLSETIGK